MTGGPFPIHEADLNNYFNSVVPYLINNQPRLGFSDIRAGAITAALADWQAVFLPAKNPATRTTTITQQKNAARDALKTLLRDTYKDIPKSTLSPADRATLRLPERATSYRRAAKPQSAPIGSVRTLNRWEHRVYFRDSGSSGSKARPEGMRGCQVWMKPGSPPQSEKDLHYQGTATRSPFTVHFESGDAGKQAYYWLRWENSRGECGPWSEALDATVTG